MESEGDVRELLERMVRALVDHPQAVSVATEYDGASITFIVKVAMLDLSNGESIAHSLRIIVSAMGKKRQKQMRVEVKATHRR